MGLLLELVRAIRTVRAEHAVNPSHRTAARIAAGDRSELLETQRHLLVDLARLDGAQFQIVKATSVPDRQAIMLPVAGIEIYVTLTGAADPDTEEKRLEKELAQIRARMTRSQELLSSESFLTKAPAHIVARERSKLADLEQRAVKLGQQIQRLRIA
jgi:valyl-tRNA synthetase